MESAALCWTPSPPHRIPGTERSHLDLNNSDQYISLSGNFPKPEPPPTFVPPITTRRPTVKPSTATDEKTTPNDNNLPPGPD